ncbi:hypothetical protein ACHWQZ_G011875 [Mnemiopsis leidyi]
MIIFLLLLVGTGAFRLPDDMPVDYSGYKTLRIALESNKLKDLVALMVENEVVSIMDEGLGDEIDILVSGLEYPGLLDSLTSAGASYQILSEDVGADIEEEKQELLRAVPGVFDFNNYYAVKYQHSHIDALVARHPDQAETFSIGQTYEGREMKVIRISNDLANADNKPMIWVDGGIHAREWISSHTVLYIANALLSEIETGLKSQVNAMLDKYQFVILPMSNPDGYEYSRTHNRMWRKTRRPSGCKYGYTRPDGSCYYGQCYGIDPNRNFDADFGKKGVSSNPCSDVYPGKQAFSEKNTQAMRDFLLKHKSNLALYLSFHSYSQLFLKPIGFDINPPKDSAVHDAAGAAAVNAIYQTHGMAYKNIRSVELYPTSGSSADWIYLEGVTNAYTIELRDTGRYGFRLPTSQIIPTGEENIRGFIALVNTL